MYLKICWLFFICLGFFLGGGVNFFFSSLFFAGIFPYMYSVQMLPQQNCLFHAKYSQRHLALFTKIRKRLLSLRTHITGD